MFAYLYFIKVLSSFKGKYIIGRYTNDRFICWIFSFVKGKSCFSWYNLENTNIYTAISAFTDYIKMT